MVAQDRTLKMEHEKPGSHEIDQDRTWIAGGSHQDRAGAMLRKLPEFLTIGLGGLYNTPEEPPDGIQRRGVGIDKRLPVHFYFNGGPDMTGKLLSFFLRDAPRGPLTAGTASHFPARAPAAGEVWRGCLQLATRMPGVATR